LEEPAPASNNDTREEIEMKIDPAVLEAIKNMDLPSLIRGYGIELKPTGKNAYQIRCPFHEDKNPSLSVGYRNSKWMWNCFGCRAHGNTLDFRIAYEKISFSEAYQKGEADLHLVSAGSNGDGSAARPLRSATSIGAKTTAPSVAAAILSRPTTINRSELLTRAVQIYHEALLEDRKGTDYLAGRGIKDGDFLKRFKIGYVNGRLRRILPEDPDHEFVRGLIEVGILNDKGREHFHGCVVFPIFDDNGAVVGMYGRGTSSLPFRPEHLYLPGPRQGVWNGGAVKAYKEIILAESIIDAASFHALGRPNAVALYGVNGLTETHLALFREHRTTRVILCLDNDKAGAEGRTRIKEKITPLGVAVVDLVLPRQYKDANVALKYGMTGEELQRYLPSTKEDDGPAPVSAGQTPGPQPAVAGMPPAPLVDNPEDPDMVVVETVVPVTEKQRERVMEKGTERPHEGPPRVDGKVVERSIEEREDGIYMSFGRRTYRVRGLSGRIQDNLRVNIKVDCSGVGHLDSLDLYSSKSRATFVSCCRKIFEAGEGELHSELNRLIEELEKIQALRGEEKKPDEPKVMTPEDEAEAMAALRSPTLWRDILRDINITGHVGEEANKGLVYLVGTSRLLEDPLSCSIISQSAAGKSVLAEAIERLMPPEEVRLYSRITQNGLFYIEGDGLVHKLMIIEERAGAEGADYSIRALQSKKKLIQAVPVKNPETGKITTQTMVVLGPIAYIETTTSPRLHEENATRCFEIYLDQTKEQTKLIHERQKQARTLEGLKKRDIVDKTILRHHNMQRLLKSIRVVIPFVHAVNFPADWLRTRRDHQRFLNLIEAVAFLHQHQREVKHTEEGMNYIEATIADYTIAFELAQAVMGESLTEMKPPQREVLEACRRLQEERGDYTRRDVREATGLPHRRCWELLEDLVDLEYMVKPEGKQGQTCRYRLADNAMAALKPLEGLTTPARLEQVLAQGHTGPGAYAITDEESGPTRRAACG
jgi:DNA primase